MTLSGKILKYGASIPLRFEIPATWVRANVTAISVSVTNKSGTVLDSGDATLYAGTTLNGAVSAEATSIIVASDADDLNNGDRIIIGADGEIKEVRTVLTYTSGTHTAILKDELEYTHATGADVLGMWATYTLDMSDTDTFSKGTDIWVRWTPDSSDPAEDFQYRIGTAAFGTSDLWENFRVEFPDEYTIAESRDKVRLENTGIGRLKDDLRKLAVPVEIDQIKDQESVQRGLILKLRAMIVSSGGDRSEVEYTRAMAEYKEWLLQVPSMELWQDADDDLVLDENEDAPIPDFFESHRFC